MFVYVLDQHGRPLMPCRPQKARKLLRASKARVVSHTPFTIQLRYGSSGYKQEVVAGMDTGSKKIGCAAVTNGQEIYAAEVELNNGISKKMKRRAVYRRSRRGRKTRYRKPRWENRASMRRAGRLAPSIRSKLESHLREKRFVESILPVSRWVVETANFDIHKITNPNVEGVGYQEGPQKDWYNVKAYVLHRDGYKCQRKEKGLKHSTTLCVHHIIHRRDEGTNSPNNLVTLCKTCHDALHDGNWELPKRKPSKTRHATHMGIVQACLKKSGWKFTETFGYLTKLKREYLRLPKSHVNDAIAICCGEVAMPIVILYKRHVSAGDYQQTKGKRSEVRIPTGKLFGLRKFDLIRTSKGTGFVKGKRSTGWFALADIFNWIISVDVSVKKNCVRLQARTTTLLRGGASSPP
ncbi:hypothetical protein LCGC14_2081710 [marine sediment metagenome]|uniref:HNH nuclease domain-containing protein n=1 Tax=marine sediment metagenome TaxID=412755 RepID=A0A0F9EFC7_9ZZZZ